jgi:colanic acid/amylovoran biosynthesis glycosyltransferase
MNIAYLINQYPKVSHSFIRREIQALEALGLKVDRFSIRSCKAELVDPQDLVELRKTVVILQQGIFLLLLAFLKCFLKQPIVTLKAFYFTAQFASKSDTGFIRHFAYLCEACSLLSKFAQCQITHVHTHFGTNSTTVAMLCHMLGGPSFSFTIHGPEEFDRSREIALAEKIRRAKFILAISSFTRSQLFRRCNYSEWNKIKLIRCGLDSSFLDLSPAPIADNCQFVCVGRLCEQKGQLLLINAAKRLFDLGYSFSLVLVGDGEMRPQIEELVREFGLGDFITITGWVSSQAVNQYIQSSRAFVLPSFAEGLPVVLMEALALERPVISTYVAGIPELVIPGENGWLIPPGSTGHLVEAMKTALETPVEQLQKLGKQGAEKVRIQHDAAKIAQEIIPLFQAALGKSVPNSSNQLSSIEKVVTPTFS